CRTGFGSTERGIYLMINLLPPDLKSAYHYGRLNVIIRRWVILCLAALIGLGGIATFGLVSLQRSIVSYNQQIVSEQSLLGKENYTATQAEVKDISDSVRLAVNVLKQEVLFSKLLQRVTATIPANANLTGLVIAKGQDAIDISADATDYTTATQVDINLSDPSNQIFSGADIVNIACVSGKQATTSYPCTVTIRALFAKNNPFLFINSKGAG
ncbi:MAG: hypothetical protein ACREHG_06415, partial [Candidatus Saccharimonadales bacterium]